MTPTTDYKHDPYTWEGLTGWRSYRMARPFRGMYWDIRRRLPYYWSDIRDGFTYRTFAGTIRIFFINLLPALAFQLDMTRNTGGYYGINEALFSSALAALVFSTLSCQPLAIVGITGLISLFNYTVYDIAAAQDVLYLYPQLISWVYIWAAIMHWLAAVFNLCDYMKYITDFSSNAFGMYVGIIYMIKGVEELVDQFDSDSLPAGYLSVIIALCYWFSIMMLEYTGSTTLGRPWLRKLISDYAYPIATIWWTGFSHIPGRIADTNLLRVPHTAAFHPTIDRSWFVDWWNLEAKWVFVALPMGFLLTLLFYYDANVSSLASQAKQYPLTKPAGFHWDFFLLGCTTLWAAVLGIPAPNTLVPQAPIHTDSCTEYKEKLVKSKEKDDGEEDFVEHHRKIVIADNVAEQRISHFLMALALVGTMTGPLLVVLHTMPRALFAGVFLVVGWTGIQGNGITANALYIIKERRFIDPGESRLRLRKWRIAYYIMWQALGVAFSVAISQTIAALGFPVIIVALIPLRWLILPRIFTEEELLILDAPTADADVVLASMGGRPELPEVRLAAQRRREHAGDGETGESSSTSVGSKKDGIRSRDGYRDEEEKEIEAQRDKTTAREGIQSTLLTGHE